MKKKPVAKIVRTKGLKCDDCRKHKLDTSVEYCPVSQHLSNTKLVVYLCDSCYANRILKYEARKTK